MKLLPRIRPSRDPRVLGPLAAFLALAATASAPAAQCPPQPNLQNFTGATSVGCPCFVVGEEAAAVLTAPAADYPIEILKVEITWASQFGGAPQSLENAIKIYAAGLPNPGTPQFTLAGPVLSDGFINQFDIEAIPGNKIITGGPFTVSLEFGTANAGMFFSPSIVHDGNGCQAGKNAIKAIPGGWLNACAAGVTGDWRIGVQYRRAPSAAQRNGGANPLSFDADPIELGGTFSATVDNNVAGQLTSILFAFDTPVSVPLAGGQTLLAIDLGSGELLTGGGLAPTSAGGGIDTYSVAVPSNLALCDFLMYAQAIEFGNPPFALSNAVDFRIGG